MTKTGHIATITQLEDAAIANCHKRSSAGSATGDTINIVDRDLDNQKCEIVQDDLVNNNASKGVVLGHSSVKDEDESTIYDKVKYDPRGHNYLGFHFISRLKFDKIISISIIHMLFIYTFFNTEQLPVSIWTYVWGKDKLFFFFLLVSICLFLSTNYIQLVNNNFFYRA